MGDAVTTFTDLVAFLIIFVGIPTMIVGLPFLVLGILAVRRTRRTLHDDHGSQSYEAQPSGAIWRRLLIVILVIAALLFALTGLSAVMILSS